jgi:hypothetical protein
LAALFAAWISAPFIHVHHDDGQHPIAGDFIHAHVPEPAEHHDTGGTAVESTAEHGKPLDTFTVDVSDFQHTLADIAVEWVLIEPKEDRLHAPLIFPRSHDPPPTGSSAPRSPPEFLI